MYSLSEEVNDGYIQTTAWPKWSDTTEVPRFREQMKKP